MPPLGFLLGAPLTGFNVPDLRSEPIGNRQWLVQWSKRTDQVGQFFFVVRVDGKHYQNVFGETKIIIAAPFDETPEVAVIQQPIGFVDPGFFPSHFFVETEIKSKGVITWDPPADVSDVKFYRLYWDNGTGTVGFTDADVYDEVVETGLSTYKYVTRELAAGTFKFVIRTVSIDGEVESTNTTPELTVVAVRYISPVSGESLTYDFATKKATLTWTNPSGVTAIDIFDNAGDAAKQFPNYLTALSSLGAVTTFVTGVLSFPAVFAFGIRAKDTTRFELNTSIILKLRLDATGNEISGFPPVPFLGGENDGNGKVQLTGVVDQNPDDQFSLALATQIKFFTDDGAGGPVDFVTPIATVNTVTHANLRRATFLAGPFGATARKFSAIALTAGGVESERATEITITPSTTVPPVVLTPAAAAGRC